jgi:2-oxoisovalerate dehydrogenase E1 component
MFFEHKALYRTVKEEVPSGITSLDLGKAHTQLEGSDLTIVTYGMGVHWAMDLAERHQSSIEVINLRTLVPLDFEAIRSSIARTSRVIVLQEDVSVGGYGEHIASRIARECFELLDAPVELVSSDATPVPFAATLEEGYLASARLEEIVNRMVNY